MSQYPAQPPHVQPPAVVPPQTLSGHVPPHGGHQPFQQTITVTQAESNGLGVAGFVCSLLGILTCGILGPLGLLFSMIGLAKRPRGFAIAGTVLGAIGSAWLFLGGFALITALAGFTTAMNEVAKEVEKERQNRQQSLNMRVGSSLPQSIGQSPEAVDSPSVETPPSETPSVTSPAAAAPPRVDQPLRLGDLELRIRQVAIDHVPLTHLREDTRSKDKLLLITLELRNTSQTKRVMYRGFNSSTSLFARGSGVDEHGNRYRSIDFGFATAIKGEKQNDYIDPGKIAPAFIVLETPIAASNQIDLDFDGKVIDMDDARIRWRLLRSDWEPARSPATSATTKPPVTADKSAGGVTSTLPLPPPPPRTRYDDLRDAGHKFAPRKWSSADGKFSVEASFVSGSPDSVKLLRVDSGKEIKVPRKVLSEADLEYLSKKSYQDERL